MDRDTPQTRRTLVVLTAVIGVLLACLALCMGLPQPEPVEPPPGPAPVVQVQPQAPVDAAPPPRERIIPGPGQWSAGGAHVPECWNREYKPLSLAPDRKCVYGDRVELCTVGEPGRDPLRVEQVDALLVQVEAVLGMERRDRLTVLLYEWKTFRRERRRRGLGPSVAGWFDGHVHVENSVIRWSTVRTLRHELLHAVMAPSIGCAPRSVHEGVADWFDGSDHPNAWLYLLWRGEPFSPAKLEKFITSDDGYEVGLGYAESAARVHHAVETVGEASLAVWLNRVQEGGLTEPTAAWAALDTARLDPGVTDPLLNSISEDLLGESWSREVFERIHEHPIACVGVGGFDPPLLQYGAEARRLECALIDRDPDDPDLSEPLAEAVEHYEEQLEASSERRLRIPEESMR